MVGSPRATWTERTVGRGAEPARPGRQEQVADREGVGTAWLEDGGGKGSPRSWARHEELAFNMEGVSRRSPRPG